MTITAYEQACHIEAEIANIENETGRAIGNLQRAVWDAQASGAGYDDVHRAMRLIRDVVTELGDELLSAPRARLDRLDAELGRGEALAVPDLSHEREAEVARAWLEGLITGVRNANSAAEAVAIAAYRRAHGWPEVMLEAAE